MKLYRVLESDFNKDSKMLNGNFNETACNLYSYLCFIAGIDINILKCSIVTPNEMKNFYQIIKLTRNIMAKRKREYFEQIKSQANIVEEVIPYLENENTKLKRTLKKYNYCFEKLPNKNL